MGLIGAVCRVVGRHAFQSLSRRFEQWKYTEISATLQTSTTPRYEEDEGLGEGYDDDDYDYDDVDMQAYEEAQERAQKLAEEGPKVPDITQKQARELLRKMGNLPKLIRPILRTNETVLWTIFTHYCSRKQDIPAPTVPENRRHRRKLLTQEDIWNLLRDFGLCPELCGRSKLKEFMVDLRMIINKKQNKTGSTRSSLGGSIGGRARQPFEKEYKLPVRGNNVTPTDVYDRLLAAQKLGASNSFIRGAKNHYAAPLKRSVLGEREREKEILTRHGTTVTAQSTSNTAVCSFVGYLKLLWRITMECLEAPAPAGAPFRTCMLLRRMDSSQGRVKMSTHARDFKVLPPFRIPSDASALAMAILMMPSPDENDGTETGPEGGTETPKTAPTSRPPSRNTSRAPSPNRSRTGSEITDTSARRSSATTRTTPAGSVRSSISGPVGGTGPSPRGSVRGADIRQSVPGPKSSGGAATMTSMTSASRRGSTGPVLKPAVASRSSVSSAGGMGLKRGSTHSIGSVESNPSPRSSMSKSQGNTPKSPGTTTKSPGTIPKSPGPTPKSPGPTRNSSGSVSKSPASATKSPATTRSPDKGPKSPAVSRSRAGSTASLTGGLKPSPSSSITSVSSLSSSLPKPAARSSTTKLPTATTKPGSSSKPMSSSTTRPGSTPGSSRPKPVSTSKPAGSQSTQPQAAFTPPPPGKTIQGGKRSSTSSA